MIQEQRIQLRIKEIKQETADTKTYYLEPVDDAAITYQPGQFLTFIFPSKGSEEQEIRRSYSMSSAPGVNDLPAVTVKRVSNGEISRFWHQDVRVGSVLTALPPAGRFTLDSGEGESRDIVLLGAGSGITPLFSILKHVLVHEPESKVTLLYANRRESSIIFQEELQGWQEKYPDRLQTELVLSQPSDGWMGIRGRINNLRLERMIRQKLYFAPNRARFFLCGPFELMRTAEITLLFMGFKADQIRKENFVIDTSPSPPKHSEAHRIRLRFQKESFELEVPAYTTILQAARREGIPVPYSCNGGRCATCAAICRTGRISMSINDVLTERDLAQGWVLTCTAYPENDEVVIDFP